MKATRKIRDLLARNPDRRIEEVIKVDQADEETVRNEIAEYVPTDAILDHFLLAYRSIAEAPADPPEGIGMWISGFFGSGKSSFAKILGYTVANLPVGDRTASELFEDVLRDERAASLLSSIHARIPTEVVIFDVSKERETADERIAEVMYRVLLQHLGYARDFDLAALEIDLEGSGQLDEFRRRFQTLHSKPWEERRKMARALNEASAVLSEMNPRGYPQADSWVRTLGEAGRARISAGTLAERIFDLMARRRPGKALLFVIDEVGQFIASSVDRMLDLQGAVEAVGVGGKNRVKARKAPAPCWIVVTSQEKL